MKHHLVKQPVQELPDGTILLTYWIVDATGKRVQKYSDDLRRCPGELIEHEAGIRALALDGKSNPNNWRVCSSPATAPCVNPEPPTP